MTLDLAGRHAPRVHRQDLVIEAGEAPLMRRDDLRREGAVAVPRNRDLRFPEVALQLLAAGAVAGVAAQPALRIMLLVAQVVGQLGVHRPLHQRLGQLLEKPLLADQVRRTLVPGKQFVDKLFIQFHLFPSSIKEQTFTRKSKHPRRP